MVTAAYVGTEVKSEAENLLTQALSASQEAVHRYRAGQGGLSYTDFRAKGAGWALWLDDVSVKISDYLRQHHNKGG